MDSPPGFDDASDFSLGEMGGRCAGGFTRGILHSISFRRDRQPDFRNALGKYFFLVRADRKRLGRAVRHLSAADGTDSGNAKRRNHATGVNERAAAVGKLVRVVFNLRILFMAIVEKSKGL